MTAELARLQHVHDGSLQTFVRRVGGRLKLGLYTKSTGYVLCRDLAQPFEKPSAKIPLIVRPLKDHDLTSMRLDAAEHGNYQDMLEIYWRHRLVEKGAHRGFVAVDTNTGKPCYSQWLFGAQDNDFMRRTGSPELEHDQALLEGAYTSPSFRGQGIMPAAMALIAEHANDLGARYVLTFVDIHNIASLKGCQRAGFYPDLLQQKISFAFGMVKRNRIEKLPEGDPRRTANF